MIIQEKKLHGVSMKEVWYATEPLKTKGIINYRQAYFEPKSEFTPFDTLLTDLTQNEEDIIAKMSKNTRYEVRRGDKEDIRCEFLSGDSLTAERITEFCDMFVEFWKSKGVEYEGKEKLKQEIISYAKEGQFVISIAYVQSYPCIYHTYIVDEKRVRLLHSASLYRTDDEVNPSLVGIANRYLHKEDMMFFKQQGKEEYDWGGAGKTEDVASITKFKKGFGGEEAVFYDFTKVKGIKAKAVTFLSGLKAKLR